MSRIEEIASLILADKPVSLSDYEYLFLTEDDIFDEIIFWANKIRKKFKGDLVKLCSIVNAKSGMCPEDCGFCAQSVHNKAETTVYPLISSDEIDAAHQKADKNRAGCFGIVTSGRTPTDEEVKILGETIAKIKNRRLASGNRHVIVSASLGELSEERLLYLKNCGLKRYHHNLETSESFFPNVCTTHTYADRLRTLMAVKKIGLELCCGGIFGLGEGWKHRLEFALALKEIDPDSIPLNFLNPIKGTRLEKTPPLTPQEILRIIAAFRFTLPKKDISVCGGREVNLRDLQSWIFYAGANGMMTGGYLTTCGRSPDIDRKMIEDLGLRVDYEK